MANATYTFTDMWPTSVCLDWPFAYVVGSKNNQGGTYTMECRKLKIDRFPITLVDSHIYKSQSGPAWLYSVRLQGNYLYMAGGWRVSTGPTVYNYKCLKVDKTNLGNIIWDHDETPNSTTTVSTFYDAMPTNDDAYVVCVGTSSYAQAYKLDSSNGNRLLYDSVGVYSTVYSILGFYNNNESIDVAASTGGGLSVFRWKMSDWVSTVLSITNGPTTYSGGGGELYNGSYFLSGNYYPAPGAQAWQKPVWKWTPSATEITQAWGTYQDDKTGLIFEGTTGATVDGSGGYVYTSGMQYAGPGVYDTPIQGTLLKHDLNGNYQWEANFGDNIIPYGPRGIANYGDYVVMTEYDPTVAGMGWLRLRNKSNGAIADLEALIVNKIIGIGSISFTGSGGLNRVTL